MNSMIKSFGANHHGTDYAVCDIHGCFSKLEGYLETFLTAPRTASSRSVTWLIVGRRASGPKSSSHIHGFTR